MSDTNPIQGESPLVLNGQPYTLVYDWAALAKLAKRFGKDVNLFEPDTLAGALEIGLKKHHKGITAAHIMEASPPLMDAIAAFNAAMQRSYFGHKEPPQDAGGNPLTAGQNPLIPSTTSPEASAFPSAPASSPANSGT